MRRELFLKDPDKIEDIYFLEAAEESLAFLKTIPPLIEGKRTFTSAEHNLSISYSPSWRQVPIEEGTFGADAVINLMSLHPGMDGILIVEVIDVPRGTLIPNTRYFADSVDELMIQIDDTYQVQEKMTFTTDQNLTGVAHVFTSKNFESDGYTMSKGKLYYLVHGRRIIIIVFAAPLYQYDHLVVESDQIVRTVEMTN